MTFDLHHIRWGFRGLTVRSDSIYLIWRSLDRTMVIDRQTLIKYRLSTCSIWKIVSMYRLHMWGTKHNHGTKIQEMLSRVPRVDMIYSPIGENRLWSKQIYYARWHLTSTPCAQQKCFHARAMAMKSTFAFPPWFCIILSQPSFNELPIKPLPYLPTSNACFLWCGLSGQP